MFRAPVATARALIREGWIDPRMLAMCAGSAAMLVVAVIGATAAQSEFVRIIMIIAACCASGCIAITGSETLDGILKQRLFRVRDRTLASKTAVPWE